jgi:anti-sigma regulatory factor (Ser/Thr protein kinase)
MHEPKTIGNKVAMAERLVHRFAPHVSELGLARLILRRWLEEQLAEQQLVEEILVVASELCTNAVQHAGSGVVELRAWLEAGSLVLEVQGVDRPRGVSPIVRDLDDPLAEGGRGMALVERFCDEVSLTLEGRRRTVRCRRRWVELAGAGR